jgi:hypothetical protein
MVGSHAGAALPGNEIIERIEANFTTKKAEIGISHSETPGGRAVQEKSKRMNSEGIQSINATSCGHISG